MLCLEWQHRHTFSQQAETCASAPCLSSDIAPADLRRKAATLALTRKAVKHDWHILHDNPKNEVPPCRVKSRKPYNKDAQDILSGIPEDRLRRMHGSRKRGSRSGEKREDLSRKHWTTLNILRTGVGRYSTEHPWRSGDWRTVHHVSVASQNRHLTTSSTAAHCIDHHPKLPSSKLGHSPQHVSNRLNWESDTMTYERRSQQYKF